jgi:hypothetical protein
LLVDDSKVKKADVNSTGTANEISRVCCPLPLKSPPLSLDNIVPSPSFSLFQPQVRKKKAPTLQLTALQRTTEKNFAFFKFRKI